MKVYLVGDRGPEHNSIRSIHRTRDGAFKAWNELRLELLREAKAYLKNASNGFGKEMYERIVKNLSRKDPKKIDNYPHETPYIHECDLQE